MQFYSIRFRGVKLIEIESVPGEANVADIKEILIQQFGGRCDVKLFIHGAPVSDDILISEVVDHLSPAVDGRYYVLYNVKSRRMVEESVPNGRLKVSSKSRYLAARVR